MKFVSLVLKSLIRKIGMKSTPGWNYLEWKSSKHHFWMINVDGHIIVSIVDRTFTPRPSSWLIRLGVKSITIWGHGDYFVGYFPLIMLSYFPMAAILLIFLNTQTFQTQKSNRLPREQDWGRYVSMISLLTPLRLFKRSRLKRVLNWIVMSKNSNIIFLGNLTLYWRFHNSHKSFGPSYSAHRISTSPLALRTP